MNKNMKNSVLHADRTLAILDILKKETDPEHTLSLQEIFLRLQKKGIKQERKSMYASMRALREAGYEVVFQRKNRKQGYYLRRTFAPAEILVLKDLLFQSVSMSRKESESIASRLDTLVSPYEAGALPAAASSLPKAGSSGVLEVLSLAVHAINTRHFLDFRYYDLSVTKKKQYRRTGRFYHLLPVAVMSEFGRFYIVFYSPKYKNFANYRADKIDSVKESEEVSEPMVFDAEAWRRNSFQMYAGEPATVTLQCPLSLASQIYDQFGTDLIISSISETSFTVNVRSALTPPLFSWILTFYKEITVLRPQELIDELLKISEVLAEKYQVK